MINRVTLRATAPRTPESIDNAQRQAQRPGCASRPTRSGATATASGTNSPSSTRSSPSTTFGHHCGAVLHPGPAGLRRGQAPPRDYTDADGTRRFVTEVIAETTAAGAAPPVTLAPAAEAVVAVRRFGRAVCRVVAVACGTQKLTSCVQSGSSLSDDTSQ